MHRRDGRKIPLITWAAPIDLHNTGKPDAAVWVLPVVVALSLPLFLWRTKVVSAPAIEAEIFVR